jgi:hypothetical protein
MSKLVHFPFVRRLELFRSGEPLRHPKSNARARWPGGDARLSTNKPYAGMSSRYIWWKAWTPFSCFTL